MKYVRSTRTIDPQTTVVTCQGEMDTLAVEELHQAVDPLLGDALAHLVFDLAAVEYVSSSVLSFLMVTQGRVKEREGRVSLVGASDLVRQVFEMASLDSLFDFHAKLEDLGLALQSPAAPAKGKEKAPRKEKVVALKEAKPVLSTGEGTTTPPQESRAPEKERAVPVSGYERREAREVEKIHPLAEKRSWKDYGVWIGIGVLALVSLAVSSYLYLQR
jgi:anti-sigma B factor antagonist